MSERMLQDYTVSSVCHYIIW